MSEPALQVHTLQVNGLPIACLPEDRVLVRDGQSALDLFMSLNWQTGARHLVLPMACLCLDFFDLRSGVLGEVLQKASNYRLKLAIWGDFSGLKSRALQALIAESNRGNTVWFCPDETAAVRMLSGAR